MENVYFKKPGIYGYGDVATQRVVFRRASALEVGSMHCLGDQYAFFVPYIPMVVCPSIPDFIAEYANANNTDIDIIEFPGTQQLMPQLTAAKMNTSSLLAVRCHDQEALFNFAKSVVLEQAKERMAYRLLWDLVHILAPGTSLAMPMEKLRTRLIKVYVLAVQTTSTYYFGKMNADAKTIAFCRQDRKDPVLCHLVDRMSRNLIDQTLLKSIDP